MQFGENLAEFEENFFEQRGKLSRSLGRTYLELDEAVYGS